MAGSEFKERLEFKWLMKDSSMFSLLSLPENSKSMIALEVDGSAVFLLKNRN